MPSFESSVRRTNSQLIEQDAECQRLVSEVRIVEKFLNDFGFLSFGRDFVICGERTFSLQTVSTACELTAGSIVACCESGCMADAFSLLRKYRDDLFFYLFVYHIEYCAIDKNQRHPGDIAAYEYSRC